MVTGTRLTITAWLLLCSAIATPLLAQDISLPAEFLFGRWSQGHYFGINGTYIEAYQPSYENAYSYTSGSLRATLAPLGNYVLWNHGDDVTRSVPLSLYWRPSGRVQLGIEDVYWRSLDSCGTNATGSSSRQETIYSARPQFYFMNADSFTISPEHARYWYFVGEFPMQGQLISRSFAALSRSNADVDNTTSHESPSPWGYTNTSRSDSKGFRLGNDLVFGVFRNVAVEADFYVQAAWSNQDRRSLAFLTDSTIRRTDATYDDRSARYRYSLQILAMPLRSVYLSTGVSQYFGSDIHEGRYTEYLDDSLVNIRQPRRNDPVQVLSSEFLVAVDYISAADFNPAILLDDYKNFYGHQLFPGQVRLRGTFSYSERAHGGPSTARLHWLAMRGMSSRLQVGIEGEYGYDAHSFGTRKSLRSSVSAQYRSFGYEPSTGPGWERDSKYDVAFGVIPRFGQWMIAVTAAAVDGLSYDRLGDPFFDFDDLDPDIRFDYWVLNQELGLGRRTAFTSNHALHIAGSELGKLHLVTHVYSLGLRVRPLEMVQFSVSVSDVFRYYSSAYPDHPTWTLQLQSLL